MAGTGEPGRVDAPDVDATTAGYVERRAAETPDRPALVDRRRELDWAGTRRAADEVATGLADRVEPGAVVCCQLYNCVELYLLRLAAERAGVRLVTAPTRFRANELAPIFDAVDVELAVVAGDYRGHDFVRTVERVDARGTVDRTVTLDGSGDEPFEALHADPDPGRLARRAHGPEDGCQLATTSGSTGGPDCIEVPIAARLRTARVHLRRFGVGADDAIGAVTPLVTGNADALAYHGAPQVGATVVLVERFDPATVADWIDERITVLPSVTTTTAKLLDHARATDRELSLRTLVNHASALTAALGRAAEETFGCTVQQAFGAMDFGGISATEADDSLAARLGTVGRPLDGNDVGLLTDDGRVTDEPGVVGTIVARGDHRVGASVLGRTVETAGDYVVIGDRARFDEAGRIVLLGREDDAINRAGRIIYPAEIEDALAEHPRLAEVAVAGLPDETYGERVGAFVVPTAGAAVDADELVAFLRERGLAPYKLPERVVERRELPRVPAGHKVDRNALVEAHADAE